MRIIISLFLLSACHLCFAGLPEKTDDGWETGTLSSENIDAKGINSFFERLKDLNYTNIHSVLLVRSNRLVLENYFSGSDWTGKPETYGRETTHTVQSVTKGVNALLIGIAVDQHLIPGADEKISSFFPEHARFFSESAKQNIHVRDLLSMTSGLAWDERTHSYTDRENDNIRMNHTNDPVRFVLDRPMATAPGTKYVYCSGNAILLGEIIRKASRMSVEEFAASNLFKPLNMSAYTWKGPFTNGVVHTGGGLLLRPRDMAKIGSLLLNNGRWRERQVVSENWIRALTSKQAPGSVSPDSVYGYEWTLCSVKAADRTIRFFLSDGYRGQYILVFPDHQLVVVTTAWTASPAVNFIRPVLEHILPALH